MNAADRSAVPDQVRKKAKGIRLLVLDVDGVLTDGGLHFDNEGFYTTNLGQEAHTLGFT